jgi:ribosomal protein S18 acetylase RimI-like enzyme
VLRISKPSVICQEITSLHPGVETLLALAMGNPTPGRLQRLQETYQTERKHLWGAFLDTQLVGLIGFNPRELPVKICHVSILTEYQKKGIGTQLILALKNQLGLGNLCAETDEDAVGFYQRLGFTCQPLQGPYGQRYTCFLA